MHFICILFAVKFSGNITLNDRIKYEGFLKFSVLVQAPHVRLYICMNTVCSPF
jgi:hypothetical protein